MPDLYLARLQRLTNPESYPFLTKIHRGIEKEGLRVTPDASIAQTEHPKALGSALTHSSITTDYSEALLEFITPVFTQIESSIDYLNDLHSFTVRHIEDEYIWPASMPCQLAGDSSIPIAQYGSSNIGQVKHVYRQGLAYRYGRTMQSIAGIHYNFSMPDDFWPYCQKLWGDEGDVQAFKSQCYFDLIRNFRRHSWLLIYLFGASPVLDSSFIDKRKPHKINELTDQTFGLPFATSLRMSDLGYQSKAQEDLNISYNDLDSYIQGVTTAISSCYPNYEEIGVKVNGSYRQLNTNILQIENEYYSEIRPKRVTQAGEKPMDALRERGVEYIEVRILDTNPFLPVGIDAQQIRFLDAFLLYCLLSNSPALSPQECEEIKSNQQKIVLEGRKPWLKLNKKGLPVDVKVAAKSLLTEVQAISNLLDKAHGEQSNAPFNNENNMYDQSIKVQFDKVENSELTPSGLMMKDVENGNEFIESMLFQVKKHQAHFSEHALSDAMYTQLQHETTESFRQQQQLEANDDSSFEHFLYRQSL